MNCKHQAINITERAKYERKNDVCEKKATKPLHTTSSNNNSNNNNEEQ